MDSPAIELTINFSKRDAVRAAFIYWKKRSKFSNIVMAVMSLLLVAQTFQWIYKHSIATDGLFTVLIFLLLIWGTRLLSYIVIRWQFLRQFKSYLDRPIRFGFSYDTLIISTEQTRKEFLWSSFNTRIKSSEIILLYSPNDKKMIYFPTASLSDEALKFINRKFDQAAPPVLINPKQRRERIFIICLSVLLLLTFMYLGINNGRMIKTPAILDQPTNNPSGAQQSHEILNTNTNK